MLKYIVVGSGRCGTVYVAKLLTTLGIPCTHERIFTVAGKLPSAIEILENPIKFRDSWVARKAELEPGKDILAEASYMAVPFLDNRFLSQATIIHVVRNPIKVILSFHNRLQYWHHSPPNRWERFILENCGRPLISRNIVDFPTPIEKNSFFVLAWNRLIEEKSVGRKYVRIRVEYDEDKLLNFLEVPNDQRPKLEIVNTHETLLKKWSPLEQFATDQDILNSPLGIEIIQLMHDYGYAQEIP